MYGLGLPELIAILTILLVLFVVPAIAQVIWRVVRKKGESLESDQPDQVQKHEGVIHGSKLVPSLLLIILFIALSGGIIYSLRIPIFRVLQYPLDRGSYPTLPPENYSSLFALSVTTGAVIALPLIIHVLVRFVIPKGKSRNGTLWYTTWSVLLTFLGLSYGYIIGLPLALWALSELDNRNVQSILSVNGYLGFAVTYIITPVLALHVPIIAVLVNRVRAVSTRDMISALRYILLITTGAAAILTPTTDILNLLVMALPILLVYLLTIPLIAFINHRYYTWEDDGGQLVNDDVFNAITNSKPESIPTKVTQPWLKRPHFITNTRKLLTKQVGVRRATDPSHHSRSNIQKRAVVVQRRTEVTLPRGRKS